MRREGCFDGPLWYNQTATSATIRSGGYDDSPSVSTFYLIVESIYAFHMLVNPLRGK